MALNDKLWDLLDAFHLGETFDKHGIPPIMFPIMIFIIIGLVIFLFVLPGGGGGVAEPATECGNDDCEVGENSTSCPADCSPPAPAKKTIKVYLLGSTCTNFNVVLKDSSGSTLKQASGRDRAFSFPDISAENVHTEVSSPDSTKPATPSSELLTSSGDTIRVTLADDYCRPVAQTGSIRALIRGTGGASITATVTLFDSTDTIKGAPRLASGEAVFSDIEANKYYYITASGASGYQDYYGRNEMVLVEPGKETPKTISMTPSQSTAQNATGKIEVCVSSESGGVETDGEIGLYSLDGDLVTTGSLSQCPLFRGQATSAGCFIFTRPAGDSYLAAVRIAPSGCTISEKVGPATIVQNSKVILRINLSCNNTGTIRAIVYDNLSNIVTGNVSVELYYNNDTLIKKMNMSAGGYTEYASLPDGKKVYFSVEDVPAGLDEEESSTYTIKGGENKTVRIDLAPPPPPPPNLTLSNVYASSYIFSTRTNFTVYAGSVTIEGQGPALTPANGVSVKCQSSWSQTVNANYSSSLGYWYCNMTSPNSTGDGNILVTASKTGTAQDSETLNIYLVNSSIGTNITVTRDPSSFAFSPISPIVTLYFNITYRRGNGTYNLTSAGDSNILIKFSGSDGVSRQVANTTLTKVSNGRFSASFDVPYVGSYRYELFVRAPINGTLYLGSDQYGFDSLYKSSGALSCSITPLITRPESPVNVTCTFTLNGASLGEQRLSAKVASGSAVESTSMTWDQNSKTYKAIVLTLLTECKQVINGSSDEDATLSSTNEISVADPSAAGVNKMNCPTNAYDCNSLTKVRDCYALYLDNPSYYQHLLDCANLGLSSCSSAASATCYKGVFFAVTGKNTTSGATNTTGPLYFQLSGSRTPTPISLSYTKPMVHNKTANDYYFASTSFSGPAAASTASLAARDLLLEINGTNGAVTATTYCLLSCSGLTGGGLMDLDNSGSVNDYDHQIMESLQQTVMYFGVKPQATWPATCVDVNQDGYFTSEDKLCMLDVAPTAGSPTTASPTYCPDCFVTSSLEVCNDGMDNNCDGQIDRETYNNSNSAFYAFSSPSAPEDLCSCTSKTPCEMVQDIAPLDGAVPTAESGVKRCVSINNANYMWARESDWLCNSARAQNTLKCNGGARTYYCNNDGGTWAWRKVGSSETFPPAMKTISKPAHLTAESMTATVNSAKAASPATVNTSNAYMAYGESIPATSDLTFECIGASICDTQSTSRKLNVSSSGITANAYAVFIVRVGCSGGSCIGTVLNPVPAS